MQVASVDQIRAQFPALERIHNGFPVAYFDGPAAPKCHAKSWRRWPTTLSPQCQPHWAYPTSAETDAAIEAARVTCGDLINGSPLELLSAQHEYPDFSSGATLGADPCWDELIVTELDHPPTWRPGCALDRARIKGSDGKIDSEKRVTRLGRI